MASSNVATRWRELSGQKNWDGLLHPLDLDLRHYIIHYGERAGAVGDLFNNKKESSGFGHSLYPKEEFFSGACLEKGNKFKHSVTHFFYAGSDAVESAWFGYVAVTTDEGKAVLGRRDILVAWRGTITDSEWFNNVNFFQTSASELFGTDNQAMVHSGFLSLYTGTRSDSAHNKTSARHQVRDAVRELVNKYQDEEISITVTGFSLGAALATLNAMDIVANGYNKPKDNAQKSCMVTGFVFGGPCVGNDGLKEVFKRLGAHDLHLLRITNARDPVHRLPIGSYIHLGEELKINSTKSNYLKWNVSAHNMEIYLHGVAGVQDEGFHLEVDHDVALVNKYLDRLKDKHKIPPNWWEGENRKNMVQADNGHWTVIIKE
ncbi:phospholipase A1-II 6-like [Durio zibethinus]|uniref:Phospholipase A1 n=1 Tax=Durio zibethinus TaxID=66656 RepID=A0A6P6A5P3_DURZI|nr:phospholipase A1-II 6-like [Durio zibethinus]